VDRGYFGEMSVHVVSFGLHLMLNKGLFDVDFAVGSCMCDVVLHLALHLVDLVICCSRVRLASRGWRFDADLALMPVRFCLHLALDRRRPADDVALLPVRHGRHLAMVSDLVLIWCWWSRHAINEVLLGPLWH
jgi:hypothetical protein